MKLLDFQTKYPYLVIIAVLVVLLIIAQQCGRSGRCPDPEVTVIHDTIPGDSIPVEIFIWQPAPTGEVLPPDTFWRDHPADTGWILSHCRKLEKDYNTIRTYLDTLVNDSGALIALADTVFQNKLHNRTLFYQNRRPIAVNTTIIGERPRNKWYIGATIGRDIDQFALGPSVLWVTKKRFAYSYNFDILNQDHHLTFYYKLSFRNK